MLGVSQLLATVLRVRLVPDIEQTLRRAEMARTEALRIGLDLRALRTLAVYREDRRYFQHRGISVRAIVRAAWQRAQGVQAGGGTTITQQLARTLFVIDLHKRVRRKIMEIPLALWLNKQMTKEELLDVYLCSVRYERDVMGAAAALKYFFGPSQKSITPEVALVLIERISNVSSEFRPVSVKLFIEGSIQARLLTPTEAKAALVLYQNLVDSGLISQVQGSSPLELIANLRL